MGGEMGLKIGGRVERIDGRQLSYHEFVEKFLQKNQPALITGLMDGWRASKEWVTEDGAPNLSFFSTHFGKSIVQVLLLPLSFPILQFIAAVKSTSLLYFPKQEAMSLSRSTFSLAGCELCADSSHDDKGPGSLLYLKDWHFVKEYPEYVAYNTPLFFLDDWLNLYLDSYPMHVDGNMHDNRNEINCSDYRFVYMGPKGMCNEAVWLECTQEQNEIIFVPSGWYHQVLNMWRLLLKDYKEAKECIDDIREICDDFEGLCQRNLAANTGMNFFDFFIFITRFTLAHLFLLCHHVKKDEHALSISPQKARHLTSNLLSIRKVALNMKSVEAFPAENCSPVSDVRKILEEPEFLDLCMGLKRAYGLIDVQWRQVSGPSSRMIHSKTDFCEDFVQAIGFEVANPEDLGHAGDSKMMLFWEIDFDSGGYCKRTKFNGVVALWVLDVDGNMSWPEFCRPLCQS
ncbi:hypothetical protein ACLOJK_032588 [Asimina triloba]